MKTGIKKKSNTRVIKFEQHLLVVADNLSTDSENIKNLTLLHNEIKNISSHLGYRKVRILFASIGKLQRRINEFLEVMSNETELTEENTNILKQLEL